MSLAQPPQPKLLLWGLVWSLLSHTTCTQTTAQVSHRSRLSSGHWATFPKARVTQRYLRLLTSKVMLRPCHLTFLQHAPAQGWARPQSSALDTLLPHPLLCTWLGSSTSSCCYAQLLSPPLVQGGIMPCLAHSTRFLEASLICSSRGHRGDFLCKHDNLLLSLSLSPALHRCLILCTDFTLLVG